MSSQQFNEITDERYRPPQHFLWEGRVDTPKGLYFHEIIQFCNLRDAPLPSDGYTLLGFACDEGVKRNYGRPGASEGPEALRKALAKLPVNSNIKFIWDLGDICCMDGNLEASQKQLAGIVSKLLAHKTMPILIGGGHEIVWGHYQGIQSAYGNKEITIISFDAHFDMRPLLPDNKGSSGTSFLQIAEEKAKNQQPFHLHCFGIQKTGNIQTLFRTAETYKVQTVLAEDFHVEGLKKNLDILLDVVAQSDIIYLTICLDVFAAPFAPGVSSPQPLGLYPWQLIPLLRHLASSKKVVSMDIAELCPRFDPEGMTARLAAHLISIFIHDSSTPVVVA
jgi:formiminoglutamase